MTPREIDALIAEHVMGLTIHATDWPCWQECECGTWIAATSRQNTQDFRGIDWIRGPVALVSDDPLIVEPVARFSTDPAAGDQLLDQMRADGWSYSIDWLPVEKTGYPSKVCGLIRPGIRGGRVCARCRH